jgi:hypothetical protein
MPMVPGSNAAESSPFKDGTVELELTFSSDAMLATDELSSLIDGIQEYHDLLVDAYGEPPQPLWIESVRHRNSVILLASAFFFAHQAAFIAGAQWIGSLAVPYLALRKATREYKKAQLDLEREKLKTDAAPRPAPADASDSLRAAIKEAIAVAKQLELPPDDLQKVIQATILAKLPPDEREAFHAAMMSFGIEKIESKTPVRHGADQTRAGTTRSSRVKKTRVRAAAR